MHLCLQEFSAQYLPETELLGLHSAATDKAFTEMHKAQDLPLVRSCEALVVRTVENERDKLLEKNQDLSVRCLLYIISSLVEGSGYAVFCIYTVADFNFVSSSTFSV